MKNKRLFVVQLGGRQKDDLVEAHNLFIGVADKVTDLIPQMLIAWKGATHIDAYMELTHVDGYKIFVEEKDHNKTNDHHDTLKLYVVNIGYYVEGVFGELHELVPMIVRSGASITERLKSNPRFAEGQQMEKFARSHVDDKYKLLEYDVDDTVDVVKAISGYNIRLERIKAGQEGDYPSIKPVVGYIKFSSVDKKYEKKSTGKLEARAFILAFCVAFAVAYYAGIIILQAASHDIPSYMWLLGIAPFCLTYLGWNFFTNRR